MRFYPATGAYRRDDAQPDWPRARRLVAQLEYERDVRGVENYAGTWSPAQHCRKEAATQ